MRTMLRAFSLDQKGMNRLWIAAIALVIGCSPVAVHAVQAASDSTARAVRPVMAAPGHPQREVFGFVNAGNLTNPDVGYPSWNLNLLTTVAYFGLHVNSGDGMPVTINDTPWAIYHSAAFITFVHAAHANGVRVIVSINLHDFSTASNNQVCQGLLAANYRNTIGWVVREMNWAGIDGVNVNYEGTITNCDVDPAAPSNVTNRDRLTAFVKELRAAMPGKYLAIDTFVGSAEDNQEFFDITGLAPFIDGFFVMAYDSDYENSANPPLTCSSYCFNPVSPLNTYRFNVTTSMAQYKTLVPASKIILGQPYYGRAACVADANTAHSYPVKNFSTSTYRWAARLADHPEVSNAVGHRDPIDGVTRWDTWWDASWNCIAEQYYDDVVSLGAKYDLVNRLNLGGVGFFTLDYGGGLPELWALINTYFACPVAITLPASQATTQFSLSLSAGTCSVSYFDLQQLDTTLNQGWLPVKRLAGSCGSATVRVDGYPGHTYMFRALARSTGGVVSSWSPTVSTSVSGTATASHPFAGLYTLDGWGGVHGDDSPPLAGSAYWPGWSIARAAHALPGASSPQSGAVLDGWGGLQAYGATITLKPTAYWPGWDIARDFAFLPNGTGGVVLDGWGGLHPFSVNGSTAPISVQTTAYWPWWDIARKVVIFADGSGGYVLDGWGGLHPFGINGPPPVSAAKLATTGYWPWWDIARDVVLVPGDGGHAGYVLDGWGGLHPFHPTTDGSTMPAAISSSYWPGWDIARAVWLLPGSATSGYTLDGWGGLQPFGGAPAIANSSYWPGWDIAKGIWGA
jgi:spore germination protein YaaH